MIEIIRGRPELRQALRPGPTFFVLILALFLFPSVARAETRPHYEFSMSVSWANGTVDVTQKTSFRNNTGADLSEVVFQVVPAYWDGFSLQSATVDGMEASASMDGTVLQIALPSPLARDASTEIELRYQLSPPRTGGRFGQGNGIMALGNFFPVLAVYRDGWDRHQYTDVGDAFFTEVADFDVTIATDRPLTIATSGVRVDQGGPQRFHAESVRDFAVTISDRYQVRTRDVNGITYSAYATNAARLDAYLDAVSRAVDWYSSTFAPYPYPSLSVVEIYAADGTPTAMEYPGLIMAYGPLGTDGGGPGSYSEYVVAHEVGHQWFYSLVGNDEVHNPWLDEAMATYTDMLFLRDTAPGAFEAYWQRNGMAYRSRAAGGGDRPVNTTVYDYPNDSVYFDVVYRKGAIFLDRLRTLVGDDAFFGLMKEYTRTFSNKVAEPRAFLDMAYRRAGNSFPALAAQYFSYGAFADGTGYGLDVQWPSSMVAGQKYQVSYSASFDAAEQEVWLDDRLLYRGRATGLASFSLGGVEAGEYVLRLDLTDNQGALYQRAVRVSVSG